MKIKEGYLLREVAGSNIVVPIGEGELILVVLLHLMMLGRFSGKILKRVAQRKNF